MQSFLPLASLTLLAACALAPASRADLQNKLNAISTQCALGQSAALLANSATAATLQFDERAPSPADDRALHCAMTELGKISDLVVGFKGNTQYLDMVASDESP
jgi:hypothetical protein